MADRVSDSTSEEAERRAERLENLIFLETIRCFLVKDALTEKVGFDREVKMVIGTCKSKKFQMGVNVGRLVFKDVDHTAPVSTCRTFVEGVSNADTEATGFV